MDDQPQDFDKIADEGQESLVAEFLSFLSHNKKWWLLPILLVMGLLGLVILLSATGALPFIYTMW